MESITRLEKLVIYYLQHDNEKLYSTQLNLALLKLTSDFTNINGSTYLPYKWTKTKHGWYCSELNSAIEEMYRKGLIDKNESKEYVTYSASKSIPTFEVPTEWREIIYQTKILLGRKKSTTVRDIMKKYNIPERYKIIHKTKSRSKARRGEVMQRSLGGTHFGSGS